MFSTLTNVFVFLESKHGVKTAIVVADFADGAACYDDIRRSLESKDVGVLVNNVGVIPEYPMYLTEVNPLDYLTDSVERYFA
jgi:short-subunit dehydrogenase